MRVIYLITIYWGNDDAHSAIKITGKIWGNILTGGEYIKSTWGYYEGVRFSVTWVFNNGFLRIDGPDGMNAVLDRSILSLDVAKIDVNL